MRLEIQYVGVMKSDQTIRVTEAERLRDGVIITFDDGKFAFYSASLLHAALPQAALLEGLTFELAEPDAYST